MLVEPNRKLVETFEAKIKAKLKFRGHNTNFCLTPSEDDRRKENSQKISTVSPDSGVAGGAIDVAVEELTRDRGVPLVILKDNSPLEPRDQNPQNFWGFRRI